MKKLPEKYQMKLVLTRMKIQYKLVLTRMKIQYKLVLIRMKIQYKLKQTAPDTGNIKTERDPKIWAARKYLK